MSKKDDKRPEERPLRLSEQHTRSLPSIKAQRPADNPFGFDEPTVRVDHLADAQSVLLFYIRVRGKPHTVQLKPWDQILAFLRQGNPMVYEITTTPDGHWHNHRDDWLFREGEYGPSRPIAFRDLPSLLERDDWRGLQVTSEARGGLWIPLCLPDDHPALSPTLSEVPTDELPLPLVTEPQMPELSLWLRIKAPPGEPVRLSLDEIITHANDKPEGYEVAQSRTGPWLPMIGKWGFVHPLYGNGELPARDLVNNLRHPDPARLQFTLTLDFEGTHLETPLESFKDAQGRISPMWVTRVGPHLELKRFGDLGALVHRDYIAGFEAIEASPHPGQHPFIRLDEAPDEVQEADPEPAGPEPEVEADEAVSEAPERPAPSRVPTPLPEAILEPAAPQAHKPSEMFSRARALNDRTWVWPEPPSLAHTGGLFALHLLYTIYVALRVEALWPLVCAPLISGVCVLTMGFGAMTLRSEGAGKAADAVLSGAGRRLGTLSICLTGALHALLQPYLTSTAPIDLALAVAITGTSLTTLTVAALVPPTRPGPRLRRALGLIISPGYGAIFGLTINVSCALLFALLFIGRTGADQVLIGVACGAGALLGWLRPLSGIGAWRLGRGTVRGPLDPAAWWLPASAVEGTGAALLRAPTEVGLAIHGPLLRDPEASHSRFGQLLGSALSARPAALRAVRAAVSDAPKGSIGAQISGKGARIDKAQIQDAVWGGDRRAQRLRALLLHTFQIGVVVGAAAFSFFLVWRQSGAG